MKVIIEEAGAAFIAIIVGIMMLLIVFGVQDGDSNSLLGAISLSAQVQAENYGSYADSDAAQAQGKIPESDIIYDSTKPVICSNREVDLLEYLLVEKSSGSVQASGLGQGEAVYILTVRNKTGMAGEEGVSCRGGSTYSFSQAGIYNMQVKLVDDNSRIVYKTIDFSVL